jgi:hypothetical protein
VNRRKCSVRAKSWGWGNRRDRGCCKQHGGFR